MHYLLPTQLRTSALNTIKKYNQTVILFVLFLTNTVLKGIFLSSSSLGSDEAFSVYHAQMNISSIIWFLSQGNNPPLYEIILHFWIKIFGISEFSVRLPSLIFSSVTVLYIFKLGNKFLNKRIGIYASLVFIFSNYQISYAHEARAYALLGLLSVVSMYYFMKLIEYCTSNQEVKNMKTAAGKNMIILILVNTLIVYLHYLGFCILLAQFIFIISHKKIISRYFKEIIIFYFAIVLLYLPNIFAFFKIFLERTQTGTFLTTPEGIHSIYNMIWTFSNMPVVAVSSILIIFISLIKLVFYSNGHQITIYNKLVVFWFIFIFFFMFGVSYLIPMFLDRYLMPAAVAFSLLLGICADFVIRIPRYSYIVPTLIILLFTATCQPDITKRNKPDVKEITDKIKSLKTSNSLIIVSPFYYILNFFYYYDDKVFKACAADGYTDTQLYPVTRKKNICYTNDIKDSDCKN